MPLSAFRRMSIKLLTAHSPSMDSHNLLNWAHLFFKLLFITIMIKITCLNWRLFLTSVTAADQQQAHESTYKMMLLLIVSALGQLRTPSGCCRCHYPTVLLSVTAADQQQAHELTYKMMLLLIVSALGQLRTPSGCCRCHYPTVLLLLPGNSKNTRV